MRKLVIISSSVIALLTSCATQKMGTSTYNDDVYANPKEDRIEEARIAAEKKKAQEAADKRYNDSIAAVRKAQKDKDDANPYYKDREFKYDDYYDYEYATRVRRFNNGINGLGYYDNYYTNSYWYSNNPYNYGISVYNGYSWWGSSYNSYSYNPSVNFYNSWGWGCSPSYGYGGYNPYMSAYAQGYNNGFYNGMWGNYYGYGNPYHNPYGYGSPFGYGYGYGNYGYGYPYYGYNSYGNYNGWGYYNSYDNNSGYTYYGPRTSHGGNSHRTSNPGNQGLAEKYIHEISDKQTVSVKFTDIKTPRNGIDEPIRVNNNGAPVGTGGIKQPHSNFDNENYPVRSNVPVRVNEPVRTNPIKDQSTKMDEPIRYNDPVRNSPIDQPTRANEPIRYNEPIRNNQIKNIESTKQLEDNTPRFEMPRQNYNSSPNVPFNSGGGSSPVNNGGGGHRPR